MKITMADVAREAGVSRALVSLAYRNAAGVSQATRERILATGEQLGYVHNTVAAQLATRDSQTIGVFLQDLHNEVFADIYDGIRSVLDETRVNVVLAVGKPDDGVTDKTSLHHLQRSQADVVIALGLTLPNTEVLKYSRLTPLIMVERFVEGLDSVTAHSRLGGRMATEHLLKLGHEDIAFFANPPLEGYFERLHGYQEAMVEAGLAPRVIQASYLRSDARRLTYDLLGQEGAPTAIFAHNDRTALGVLDALNDRELTPGLDVSVVGYDNTEASQAPGTALTTVDVRGFDLGVNAARIALKRLQDRALAPQSSVSEPHLMVRSTTGMPPKRGHTDVHS